VLSSKKLESAGSLGQSPKTEFGPQIRYGRVIHPSIGNFKTIKKKFTFGGQNSENKPSGPKNGIWLKNQYGLVIHPSIGNFKTIKKKFTFGGQNSENKPSEPKNGIWAQKSVWSCDTSIDREF
jgi:hypothetical protein